MQKIILFTIIALFLFSCSNEKMIIKTKTYLPTIACYQPEPYESLKNKLIKIEDIDTEGKLIEAIVINIVMMENHIKLWETYRDCVDKTLKLYEDKK